MCGTHLRTPLLVPQTIVLKEIDGALFKSDHELMNLARGNASITLCVYHTGLIHSTKAIRSMMDGHCITLCWAHLARLACRLRDQ